jgi:predicted methyltransferase MtxX (methanogen marker protein 4)
VLSDRRNDQRTDDTGGNTVEVKIGVQRTPREIVLESTLSPGEVEAAVRDALKDSTGVLSLVDEKGRKVLVPANLVAYVEIAEADHRRVGFAVGS